MKNEPFYYKMGNSLLDTFQVKQTNQPKGLSYPRAQDESSEPVEEIRSKRASTNGCRWSSE